MQLVGGMNVINLTGGRGSKNEETRGQDQFAPGSNESRVPGIDLAAFPDLVWLELKGMGSVPARSAWLHNGPGDRSWHSG